MHKENGEVIENILWKEQKGRRGMKRKYPAKMFLLFVLTNFLFRFFYLFIPGTVLCVVGIWSQTYLYVGLAVLGLDLILSIVEQVRIRNAAVGQSENPDFNEMMDAFCGQGGLRAAGKMFDEKLGFNHVDESQNKKN